METTYVSWMLGGLIMGTIAWLSDTRQDWYSLVYDASYWDNPWEVWARARE